MGQHDEKLNTGRLPTMLEWVSVTYNIDLQELVSAFAEEFPEMNDAEHCPNCDQSMKSIIYTLDFIDAATIKKIGREAKILAEDGIPQIISLVKNKHFSDTERHRTTKLAYFDLIEHIRDIEGKSLGWKLTTRGQEFLAGKSINAKLMVWRGSVTHVYEDKKTLAEIKSRSGMTADDDWDVRWYEQALREGRLL